MATTTITMPNFGQTSAEGTIVGWLKREGDPIQRGEPLAEVETDKTTVQVEAYAPGVLRRILCAAPAIVAAGAPIAVVTTTVDEAIDESALSAQPAPTEHKAPVLTSRLPAVAPPPNRPRHPPTPESGRLLATPTAQRVAQELGVDLARVVGSGPGGRILEADVRGQADNARAADHVDIPAPVADGLELNAIRRITADRMLQSVREAPQFALTVDVDLTALERQRAERAKTGRKLSFTASLVYVVARALRHHPEMNARYGDGRIHRIHEIDVGLATATSRGLLVPVIRTADQKTIDEIADIVATLGEQARAHQLPPSALGGSTFTISNLGMYGIDQFTAILNPPEAGILAVGRISRRPVAVDQDVQIRPIVTITLTVDHRALGGAEAATFLSTVRELLETGT